MGMIKLPEKAIEKFTNNYYDIFQSGNLAEGKWNNDICTWAKNYTSAEYALPVSSNGAGLFAILSILRRYRNYKRVFLQSNTMYGVKTIANSSGLELCGYVNCSLDKLMPTYEDLKNFVKDLENPSDAVFLLTHIGGWVNPDIHKIVSLCNDLGIAVVEDCAHSLGATLEGKHTGLFGVAGVYSLYATKAIPSGEGGVVVSNDCELGELVSKFSIYDRFDQHLDIGVNIRMSELNALLSLSVLECTEEIIKDKMSVAYQYIHACDNVGLKYFHPEKDGQRSNLYKFIVIGSRDQDLKNLSIRTSSVYDYSLGDDPFGIVDNHVCLPIWYQLENEKVSAVIEEINSIVL
jgi:dTDP-4-amino-4,6-dideoxygalactose transaminase